MQLTRLAREQQVPVAPLLGEERTRSVRSAVAMLQGGASEPEKKKNNLRSTKACEIAARMREVAESLYQAGKRWIYLVQIPRRAHAPLAQARGEDIAML